MVYLLGMDKNQATELYNSGLSIRRVAEIVGSNRESVRKLLVKSGKIRGRLDYHDPWEVRIEENMEVDLNSGCWLWCGTINNMGYGMLSVNGKNMLAHRAMYGLKRGDWFPSSVDMCHKCDTPSCINPDHLFPGTRSDNMRDAHRKGRLKSGEQSPTSKYPDSMVSEARRLWSIGMGQSDIGRAIGVSHKWVHAVVRGRCRVSS